MAVAAAGLRPSVICRRLMERLPIRTPERRIVPLRLNAAQERLWQVIAPRLDARLPIRIIILKARRMGMSTEVEALLTTLCVLEDYTNALVIGQKGRSSERIWEMSDRFVQGSALKHIAKRRGHTIFFRHSELELQTAGSPDAARSADLTCFHASEVAFWPFPEAMTATMQCLPRDEDAFQIAVIESTANGMVDQGELYYDHWQRAVQGESSFIPVFLPWHTFPAYTSRLQTPLDDLEPEEEQLQRDLGLTWGQLRWRRRVLADDCEGNPDKFDAEYPATPEMAFIISGTPFFRAQQLAWMEPDIVPGRRGRLVDSGGRIRFQDEGRGRLTVFRAPEPGHEYIIGADSAMGIDDADHSRSAAQVLDMATLEQVAEYEAPSAPHELAADLVLMGKAYNTALLFPEIQNSGGGGGSELLVYLRDQHMYPYIGTWRGRNDRIRPGAPTLYGWETTSRTKPMMMARIREVVMERSCTVHSRALVKQLRSYGAKDSGAMEALAGHDDLLMAFGIALMGRFQNYTVAPQSALAPPVLPFDQMHVAWQRDVAAEHAKLWEEVLSGQATVGQPQHLLAW
jgi:hypothetical protein